MAQNARFGLLISQWKTWHDCLAVATSQSPTGAAF